MDRGQELGEDGEDISHELRALEPVTRRFISLGNYQAGPLSSRPVLSATPPGGRYARLCRKSDVFESGQPERNCFEWVFGGTKDEDGYQ